VVNSYLEKQIESGLDAVQIFDTGQQHLKKINILSLAGTI